MPEPVARFDDAAKCLSEVLEPVTDPALRLLFEVWSELPERMKNHILRLADETLRS